MKNDVLLKLDNLKINEVLERSVAKFGTGCHIIMPLKHKDKKAVVIILED